MTTFFIAIDQGTTSSRAIVFNQLFTPISIAQEEFAQIFPQSGWVEHNPEDIWETTLSTCRKAIEKAEISVKNVSAIGITNQRETTILWDRSTGNAVYNAIVWQDRRTSSYCTELKNQGLEAMITSKTGLLLDAYFSATKVKWLFDNVDGLKAKAEKGEIAFGTVDSFLLWRLTDGKVHATDATNASRTMLFNIHDNCWDEELLNLFSIPKEILPTVHDCSADYGMTDPNIFGRSLQIGGIAGDQQAALIGQACFKPGMIKSTYGTGCFLIQNSGDTPVISTSRLLTTIGYRLRGKTTYGLEGSIFIAGAGVQWMRDSLGLLQSAGDIDELARQADPSQDVYLVPAFTGLGAPYWDGEARGAIFGITRNTGPREIARSLLQAVCFQTRDLIEAMEVDLGSGSAKHLRVDGGMVASGYTMQFLADILGSLVDRPPVLETTALGVAYLAGMFVGEAPSPDEFADTWKPEIRFSPQMDESLRNNMYDKWKDAVRRTLTEYNPDS